MAAAKSTEEKTIGRSEAAPGPPSEQTGNGKIVYIERIEWIGAILLSALVLFFIISRTVHGGALWRDECDSLQLARMPRFSDLLHYLQYTAFPVLFPTIVRTYTTLFGTSDVALRCFGLIVGILFLGVAWFQSRILHRGTPLLLTALIGLNLNFLTAGLWLRGYGLGCVLIILAFALTAKFLLQPNTSSLLWAGLAYLASMQCLYFNGVLVPTMVLAASVVLLIRREWKWMWRLLGVAAVCGLTYLPYIWTIYFSTRNWAVLVQTHVPWKFLGNGFLSICGGQKLIGAIAWRSIVVLCIIAGAWRLKIVWNRNRTRERDMLLFALLTIPVGILAHYGYLQLMKNLVVQRYHLALVSMIAAAVTLIAANISTYFWLYLGRIALIALAMVTVPFAPWSKLTERVSNIDVVTRRVEKEAGPNDLIVVNNGQLGISFNHYYHGTTRWITVPQIEDHRLHRYDLMKKKIMEFFPLNDVKEDIAATLKSGNRVWIVGALGRPSRQSEFVLAPAPDPEVGWQLPRYIDAWSREFGTFLRRHAGQVTSVVRQGESVNQGENPQLIAVDGWRY